MNTPVTLLTSIVEHHDTRPGGYQTVQFDTAGESHAKAMVEAVAGHYHRITGRPRPDLTTLRELTGARVTVAYTSRSAFGAPFIEAREGTLMPLADYYADTNDDGPGDDGGHPTDTRLVLRPAGNRTRAVALHAAQVLDAERGYGHLDRFRGLVALTRNHLPQLAALTREDLLALPSYNAESDRTTETAADAEACDGDGGEGEAPTFIRLAVMGTWRGPDCDSPAAVWLLHSYDPNDDIAEGYLLVDPALGYSEHGSLYGHALLRFGGRIVLPATSPVPNSPSTSPGTSPGPVITRPDGQPLTLTDCFALGEQPQEQWLTYFTR